MSRVIAAPALQATGALFLLDLLAAALAWPVAAALLAEPGAGPAGAWMLLHPAAYLAFLYSLGLYRREMLVEPRRGFARVPLAAVLGALAAALPALLLPGGAAAPASQPVFVAAVAGLSLAGIAARIAFAALRGLGLFRRRVLVVGTGTRAADLVLLLRREGTTPAYDVALVPAPEEAEPDRRIAADTSLSLFPPGTAFLEAARAFGADQVIVAPDDRRGLPMAALLACRTAGYPVSEYLRALEREIGRIDIKRIELGWLLYSDGFRANMLDHALKRAFDITVSVVLLTVTAPVLLAAAMAVRLQDGGPALYRQQRVTRGGRVFRIMKLRTMLVDAERAGATWAAEGDPRITALGRLLRQTRVDELPQLVNVLRGDMSIVGPRPERPEFTAELAKALPLYEERHLMRSGLTGWAQVNYPYGASLDDARSKLSYDLYYVKNFAVLFDLLILMQTLRVVVWPGGGAR